ncbi:MAG TPA: hypothetical protein VKY19_20615 [Ktedonosporobacter sp.]|nr:hypothetical protein [Ktedonosporobacter sp.]
MILRERVKRLQRGTLLIVLRSFARRWGIILAYGYYHSYKTVLLQLKHWRSFVT